MWLVANGLRDGGRRDLAAEVVAGIEWLVRAGGFSEYFDPVTGTGHGSDHFAWTAALFLDVTRNPTGSSPAPAG